MIQPAGAWLCAKHGAWLRDTIDTMPLGYPQPELVEGLTRLRRWSLNDLSCIEEATTDARIPEGTTVPVVYTPSEGTAFIERQWTRNSDEGGLSLAIADSIDDRALGLIVLQLRPQHGVASVGYWIVPSSRRVGHAGRAIRLLTDWALGEGGLARIEAWVEPGNEPSRTVLMRCGFEYEGTLRSALSFPTRRADAMVFARLGT